jgi:hypothetical protein
MSAARIMPPTGLIAKRFAPIRIVASHIPTADSGGKPFAESCVDQFAGRQGAKLTASPPDLVASACHVAASIESLTV